MEEALQGAMDIIAENISDVAEYTDSIYVTINNNKPYFTQTDYTTKSFEIYSELDEKGRCGGSFCRI